MKEVIGKYAFEVVVIFIGITASFLFEEWRQNQEKKERAIEIMQSMVIELERNDQFIHDADTFYINLVSSIDSILLETEITQIRVAEASFDVMEGISNYRLKDISAFIHGFSSADQIHILNKNREILRYMSYMESLLTEHEIYTNDIGEYANKNLWPIISDHGLADYFIFEEDLIQEKKQKNNSDIRKNQEFLNDLKWFKLKILRLIQINQAIHRRVQDITRELNKAIKQV